MILAQPAAGPIGEQAIGVFAAFWQEIVKRPYELARPAPTFPNDPDSWFWG